MPELKEYKFTYEVVIDDGFEDEETGEIEGREVVIIEEFARVSGDVVALVEKLNEQSTDVNVISIDEVE